MARAKKQKAGVDPEKEAETRALLNDFKNKFKNDLADLEKAKRDFCSSYVDAMMVEFERSVPEHLLNMKASEFVRSIKEADNDMAEQMNELEISGEVANPENMKTPTNRMGTRPFKSMMTPSGVAMNIPSMITPRVDGPVIRSRQSRVGEVLFSVNGTPVMNTDHLTQSVSTVTKKEQTKVVEQLLQRSETDMSPATRKIMQQLRMVLVKKTTTTTYEQGQEEQENQTPGGTEV